jgi:diaminohydroxyphosphoribosylaminopyrimidine deaminase/5-amino-6-(5-phosphoribosylamino)uracil reductase
MERALLLAERGRGRTAPNPSVGAVVVSPDGIVIGQGTTAHAGGPHAEVEALAEAGDLARGATLYSTLEPCFHHGRTGPCVARIVTAGIRRVVVAVADPNPLVAGQGLAYLKEHGVEVVEGLRRAEAVRQHAAFFIWVLRRRPCVTLKAAISRDGFVGSPTERLRLTGDAADRYFHRQRAEVDAIAVGSGTVLVDDPLLTARGAYRFRPLIRVIFDWRGRVPPSARVFSTRDQGPILLAVSAERVAAEEGLAAAWRAAGAEVIALEERRVLPVLETLAARDVLSLLVEGGPTLQRVFMDAGVVDRVQWVVAPVDLGQGVPYPPELRPDALPRTIRRLGRDTFFEFDVYRPDRNHRTG